MKTKLDEQDLKAIKRIQSNHIELADGSEFLIAHTTHFNIENIAHSLSMLCRFTGNSKRFYSVGQHSILVALLMRHYGGDPIEGLLHDASESIANDLATPLKRNCSGYAWIEKNIEHRIRRHFGLPSHKTPECQWADSIALFMEAYHLLPSRGLSWEDPADLRPTALKLMKDFDAWLEPMFWPSVKAAYLKHYKKYSRTAA
jgi:hypothetical protein